jgi:hypothetical protein
VELQRDPRRAIEVRTRVRDVPVCSSDNRPKAGPETDKSEKIKRSEDTLEALKARDGFKQAIMHYGYYGRGHIYIVCADARGR